MTADLPDRADDRERVLGPCVECHQLHAECTPPAFCCDDCLHLATDLTPGVVWTDAQLAVVRDLTARAFRAKQAVERVRGLVAVYASDPYCWTKGDDVAARIRDALDGGDS